MMRGRHIEKRVPSKELLSVLDKAETAGSLSLITNSKCCPDWKSPESLERRTHVIFRRVNSLNHNNNNNRIWYMTLIKARN